MIDQIRKFTDSTSFANALKVTLASALPFIFFSFIGQNTIGFTVALGAFLTYPSDIPSNLSHKIKGVLIAALIVASCNLLVNLFIPYNWLFYPIILALLFFLSMISVYGHRANMISFSALLAVCLSTGQLHAGENIYLHAVLMFGGGLFYLLISLIFYFVRPNRYIEMQVAECLRLTSKYLKLRGDLWNTEANKKKITKKQLTLQVELNTIHENIREILIRNRTDSNNSTQNRKMLLVFISLVEIMELALSTSFDHDKLHEKFKLHPNVLNTYQKLAYRMAANLKNMSESIENNKKFIIKYNLTNDLEKLEAAVANYSAIHSDISEGVLMLNNMVHYAEKQIEKIKTVQRSFTSEIDIKELKGRDKDLEKFLTPVYYPIATLIENLTPSSTIFRHSLRLTLTLLLSFVIGTIFDLTNVYWILLTIVVIMRPGYGLTKKRSFERIYGTIAGALIAFTIVSFVHNTAILGALIVICVVLGFTFTSINYKIGVTFITMYVVFLYGILVPDINSVIYNRILDTVIAAVLVFIANHFFWPYWEFLNLPVHLKKSLEANRNYLQAISTFYNDKGEVTTSYRLARKNAFVEVGNLMASYQRMSQEPKSKQKQISQVYELVVLNHTLLSAEASLGTYIQSHKTTKASEAFNRVVDTVIANLAQSVAALNDERFLVPTKNDSDQLATHFTALRNIRAREIQETALEEAATYQQQMQESQLVIEQLVWMTNVSNNILKLSHKIQIH